jgi:hypothetical protein
MRYRPWFLTYLRFIAVATVFHGIGILRDQNGWCLGDWLINYHAGFVRRGLTGEIALRVGHGVHLSPLIVVLLMQLACYAAMLFAVHRLVSGTRLQLWTAAALVSPATLGFHVLEPTGGFRKEIILLGGLGLLMLLVLRWPKRSALTIAYLSLLVVTCVLSHESLILFGAYVVAALAIGLDSISRAIKLSLLPAALAVAAVVVVSHHPGNEQMARNICWALGYPATGPLPPLCGGAIAYLSRNLSFGRSELIVYFNTCHYGRSYPILALLALLPVFMAYKTLWRYVAVRRSLAILTAASLISFAASSPLFFYALDWGRWIYIHVFCIFLLLLLIEYRRQKNPAEKFDAVEPASRTNPGVRKVAAIVFLLIYATCWELPFVGRWTFPSGYVRIVGVLLKHDPPAR